MKLGNPPEYLLWDCVKIYWLKCVKNGDRFSGVRVDCIKELPNELSLGRLSVYRHPTVADIQLRTYDILDQGVVLTLWGFKNDPEESLTRAVFLQNEWYILDKDDELDFILPSFKKGLPINRLRLKVTETADDRQTEIEIGKKNNPD